MIPKGKSVIHLNLIDGGTYHDTARKHQRYEGNREGRVVGRPDLISESQTRLSALKARRSGAITERIRAAQMATNPSAVAPIS